MSDDCKTLSTSDVTVARPASTKPEHKTPYLAVRFSSCIHVCNPAQTSESISMLIPLTCTPHTQLHTTNCQHHHSYDHLPRHTHTQSSRHRWTTNKTSTPANSARSCRWPTSNKNNTWNQAQSNRAASNASRLYAIQLKSPSRSARSAC